MNIDIYSGYKKIEKKNPNSTDYLHLKRSDAFNSHGNNLCRCAGNDSTIAFKINKHDF